MGARLCGKEVNEQCRPSAVAEYSSEMVIGVRIANETTVVSDYVQQFE